MGDHIFICFSSKDKDTALEIVDFLEREGLECWISVRDVPGGHNYQETIIHALERANCIVFLFSHASSESGEIKKELSVAASLSMPVFPLRLDPVTPKGALRYELATRQWIDIFEDRDEGLARLVETIRSKIHNNSVPDPEAGADDLQRVTRRRASPTSSSSRRRPRKERACARRSLLPEAANSRRCGRCWRATSVRLLKSTWRRPRRRRKQRTISANGLLPTSARPRIAPRSSTRRGRSLARRRSCYVSI